MKCMRCGAKIQPSDVFCEPCLDHMAKHPVDPSTPITLPIREKHAPVKRSKKRYLKPEEQQRKLRRLVGWLLALVLILSVALAASIYLLLAPQDSVPNFLPGQNYGTDAGET